MPLQRTHVLYVLDPHKLCDKCGNPAHPSYPWNACKYWEGYYGIVEEQK